MAEEIDMTALFYKLANSSQEGEDAVMDRKKITRALKVGLLKLILFLVLNVYLFFICTFIYVHSELVK